MNDCHDLLIHAEEIEKKIGYTFKDRSLLTLAFTHRSYVNEHEDAVDHNERLEFLGDSILGLIIADYLYHSLTKMPEGELSYLRSRLVEATSCFHYAQKLDIEMYLLLGKGERMNNGRGRDSILADLFEAIIGAIFIDGDIEAAKEFIFKNFSSEIEQILKTPLCNWKANLQDYCQKKYHIAPVYELIDQFGPDHGRIFKIAVKIKGELAGIGEGSSKKEAQQSAAEAAYKNLQSNENQRGS